MKAFCNVAWGFWKPFVNNFKGDAGAGTFVKHVAAKPNFWLSVDQSIYLRRVPHTYLDINGRRSLLFFEQSLSIIACPVICHIDNFKEEPSKEQ